ncbi:MAG: PepSY domain-containing protein [Candidatus Andeanibacterium colombiense]|uniref:PepSY domain-containing protein n=1 Tax=Candidatus Andeanibacterium colombiense TaxID=3121345 RepID=A0AAJ5X8G9_9SPHN|nr:MAG: PepSY domain-containing protein [Sphingomonadaceae bacterium]
MGRWGLRVLFLTHRWTGVALALLMAMWALSGVVMMYSAYPETTREERLAGLAPLDFSGCCKAALPDQARLDGAVVEMLEGEPVLREPDGAIRLTDGKTVAIAAKDAAIIAAGHLARSSGAPAPTPSVASIRYDQWTVQGASSRTYPLYKASFADPAGTVLYVSGKDGRIVQDTTRRERFWNWLGAIPHWLYFAELRKDGWLWQQVVVYASLLGTFLTVTGIYIGIRQYGRGKRRIPYRGWAYWHHVTGLVFGLFTLTWIVSGLFSMQPWGWMESPGADAEQAALAGRPADRSDALALVEALRAQFPPGAVSAELSIQGKAAFALISDRQGGQARYTLPALTPAAPTAAELRAKTAAALPGTPLASAKLLRGTDAYYYSHHTQVRFPVWRAIYRDRAATRLYFDPATGELIAKVDAQAREFRWWHSALHRLDFGPLNARPLWDAVMLPLMAGVSLLCLVGLWLGIRRLRRSFR